MFMLHTPGDPPGSSPKRTRCCAMLRCSGRAARAAVEGAIPEAVTAAALNGCPPVAPMPASFLVKTRRFSWPRSVWEMNSNRE